MQSPAVRVRRRAPVLAFAAAVLAAAALAAGSSAAEQNQYTVHNLVSDQAGVAAHVDTNLVNAWGLDARPTSPWWVADNENDVATVYNAAGDPFPPPPASPLVVQVLHAPTGLVANPGTNFVVSAGSASGAALFLFATEEGTILGWNPAVSPDAVVAADLHSGAIYKGLAVSPAGDRLYATDFHNGRVDVFDGSFAPVGGPGAFADPGIPSGFAPFGIQAVGDRIFVTYAKQDADHEDDVDGQGLGFVDVYDAAGALLGRVAGRGQLNAPWGIALAPGDFGRFGGDLLVGNFGDGRINAYRQLPAGNYEHAGRLKSSDGGALVIDGLWALEFGKGAANNGSRNTLFFTAGPDDESHGLFGSITAS